VTDWTAYLACDVCEAKMGGACFALLSGGPEALPPRYAGVPHSSRKLRGTVTAKGTAKPRGSGTANVARRTAKRTEATAKSWAAVAKRQGKI
jgi:hypothetical protein